MGLQHNGRLVFLTVDLRHEPELPRRFVTMPAHKMGSFGRDDHLVIAGYGLIWRVLYPRELLQLVLGYGEIFQYCVGGVGFSYKGLYVVFWMSCRQKHE